MMGGGACTLPGLELGDVKPVGVRVAAAVVEQQVPKTYLSCAAFDRDDAGSPPVPAVFGTGVVGP